MRTKDEEETRFEEEAQNEKWKMRRDKSTCWGSVFNLFEYIQRSKKREEKKKGEER